MRDGGIVAHNSRRLKLELTAPAAFFVFFQRKFIVASALVSLVLMLLQLLEKLPSSSIDAKLGQLLISELNGTNKLRGNLNYK